MPCPICTEAASQCRCTRVKLYRRIVELEAKLERLEKAARGVLLDARMGWTSTNCLNELEEALEGEQDG